MKLNHLKPDLWIKDSETARGWASDKESLCRFRAVASKGLRVQKMVGNCSHGVRNNGGYKRKIGEVTAVGGRRR